MIHYVDPHSHETLQKFSRLFPLGQNLDPTGFGHRCPLKTLHFLETRFRGNLGSAVSESHRQAGFGAMGEALERYSFRHVRPDYFSSSYEDLQNQKLNCLDPDSFKFFSEDQAAILSGEVTNLTRGEKISWTWFEDALSKKKILLPAIFNQYFKQKLPIYYSGSSSGNACATSVGQSKLSAVLELMERDAVMFYWWTRNTPDQIDLSQPDPELHKMIGLFESMKNVNLFHLKTDLNTNTVLATFRGDLKRREPLFAIAAASNLNPVLAIKKALYELAQSVWYFNDFFESLPKIDYDSDFEKTIWRFEDHWMLYAHYPMKSAYWFLFPKEPKWIHHKDLPNWDTRSTDKNIALIAGSFKSQSHRLYFSDITSRDLKSAGFSVSRAFSPDLVNLDVIHKHRELGLKRYYALPKKMKLSNQPRAFADLNPYPHPFP